jgi:hypothetical protein
MIRKLFWLGLFATMANPLLFGQKYAKSQFTLYSFSFNIDDKIKLELSPLENYIKFKPDKKQDKITGMLVNSLYYFTNQFLTDSLSIYILPINSLGKIKYDDYGYPNTNIQKALKFSDTKYFLKIDASLENDVKDNKKNNEDIFKPKIKITLSIYNKYGFLPIQTSESSATAENPIKISQEFISGMNFVDASILKKPNTETLRDIYFKAILQAVLQLKYKSNK